MDRVELTANAMVPSSANCCQAILSVYAPDFGLTPPLPMALGRPFGGGLNSRGDMCGFVQGAVMIIGLAGHRDNEAAARKRTTRAVGQLLDRFEAQHGSLQCRHLLGADLSTEAGLQQARADRLFETRCPAIGQQVAQLLEDVLAGLEK